MKHAILFVSLVIAMGLEAQTWTQLQKIVNDDREPNDELGNAVDISGDYAIVAAMREDDDANGMNAASDAGSVYIYSKAGGTWTQEAKLVAADRQSNDFFGRSVGISGDYCIIGADQEGTPANAGAAYIFERNGAGTWVQVKKLEAPVQKANDYFGFSVDISGSYAVVGAYFEDEDENEANEVLSAGSAYIFKRNDTSEVWEFHQKIVASDRSGDDRFGMSVAIDGDYIVVGSEFDDVDGANGMQSNAGSAYAFARGGGDVWTEEAQLTASDYGQSENFGWSVGVSGEYAVVGAYKNDTDADGLNSSPDAGAAYFFERGGGTWPQVKKVVSSDRANIDFFGYSVAIDGDLALIGAYRQNFADSGSAMFSDAGAAYVIERDAVDGWQEKQKINHTVRATLDQFGIAVGIDGTNLIVGATLEDEDESNANTLPDAGAAFVFTTGSTSAPTIDGSNIVFYPNPVKSVLNIKGLTIGLDFLISQFTMQWEDW